MAHMSRAIRRRSLYERRLSPYRIKCTIQVYTRSSGNTLRNAWEKPLQATHYRDQHVHCIY